MPVAHLGADMGLDAAPARRAVRSERAEVARWRRLLRARLDLLVASYAPPGPLGTVCWDVLPDAQLALPLADELLRAVALPPETDRVEAMRRLRDLDRQLATYAEELDSTWDMATEGLVRSLVFGELNRSDAIG